VPPLQLGALGGHCVFCTHWTHRHPLSPPSAQYGVAPEQSASLAHITQRFRTQAGVDVPTQSALLLHCTHCWVVGSQMLWEVGQLAAVMQPTHAPVTVLQIRSLLSWEHD
jgi:hypothetical protein